MAREFVCKECGYRGGIKTTLFQRGVCPSCDKHTLIPSDSPVGKKLLEEQGVSPEITQKNVATSTPLNSAAVSWVGGIFLILLGMPFTSLGPEVSPLAGIFLITIGVLILPPIKKRLIPAKVREEITSSRWTKAVLVGVILVSFGYMFVDSASTGPSSTVTSPSTPTQPQDLTSKARIISENFVRAILKAPSTADFPWLDYSSVSLGDNRYRVSSYVDSQNGFGAQIRSNWQTTLRYNGGDWADPTHWTLEKLIFDGEVLYSVK